MSCYFNPKNNDINFVFQPMFGKSGQLVAVECLSRLHKNGDFAHLAPEKFFQQADSDTRIEILLEQVSLIEKYQSWFRKNRVIATLNVDDHSLCSLANDHFSERISKINCIHFEISEHSTQLIKNRLHGNPLLNGYSFWLDDFGSGYAGFSALYNSQFHFVKLDRFLLWDFMEKPGGKELMHSLLRYLSLNQHRVIIEGVETAEHKKWLDEMPYHALQGKLWKESDIKDLSSFLTAEYF